MKIRTFLIALGIALLGTFAGTATAKTETSSCVISSFDYSPTSLSAGDHATLSWKTSDCVSVRLTGGMYSSALMLGSSAPTGPLDYSTTYQLLGHDSRGIPASKAITVPVGATTPDTSCMISYFEANPAYATYGNSTTLNFSAPGCTSITIYPNVGTLPGGATSANSGAIYGDTIFTMTATASDGTTKTQTKLVSLRTTGTGWGTGGWGTSNSCSINSFYANPSSVTSGQPATIYWQTNGCSSIQITGNGISTPSYLPATGYLSTNPLFSDTTFTIHASGSVSQSQSITVSVGGGAITLPATNVSRTRARLNGAVPNTNAPMTAYFEYGTTMILDKSTTPQSITPNQFLSSLQYYDTVTLSPNTNYYFRSVVHYNGTLIRGNILSFTTTSDLSSDPLYTDYGFGNTVIGSTGTASAATGITLSITNSEDKVYSGETINYTIAYANNTKKSISNTSLSIVLPAGFTIMQSTQGRVTSPSTLVADLGTLAPGKSGTIFLQAKVADNVSTSDTLVTNGTLSYTLSSGKMDSTVAYILNHAGTSGGLGGFAFGSGFFPTTALGWFITILIILAIVLIIRRISKAQAGHGHGAGHGGGHH